MALLFYRRPSIHTNVVEPLFNAFFLALMLMLVFSSSIILYGGLFSSPEVSFLLTTPTRAQRIYQHKFQEAVWFSSWGFVLLGSPTLVAYGVATAGALVLLRAVAAVCNFLCIYPGGAWAEFCACWSSIDCPRFACMHLVSEC